MVSPSEFVDLTCDSDDEPSASQGEDRDPLEGDPIFPAGDDHHVLCAEVSSIHSLPFNGCLNKEPPAVEMGKSSDLVNPMSSGTSLSGASDARITLQSPDGTPGGPRPVDIQLPRTSETNEITISDSDDNDCNDKENEMRVESPRTFHCIYCDYSTVEEHSYHKHIAVHLPGTKPYSRLYCSECSYSTGSHKFLLFHMAKTHFITPKYYKSGENRYTCVTCRASKELRSEMISHVSRHEDYLDKEKDNLGKKKDNLGKKKDNVGEKKDNLDKEEDNLDRGKDILDKENRPKITMYQCVEKPRCSKKYKSLKALKTHVSQKHQVIPSFYRCIKENPHSIAYECFSCDFKDADRNNMTHHECVAHLMGEVVKPMSGAHVPSPGRQAISPEPHSGVPEYHDPFPEPPASSLYSSLMTSHGTSRELRGSSSSPELRIVSSPSRPGSPEPDFFDGEQLVDMPEYNGTSPLPPYLDEQEIDGASPLRLCIDEEERENLTDTCDPISDSETPDPREAPRSFHCIYCDYSTFVEEWYHQHIATHLPDADPYSRIYCTECSYSTGSEKYLLFHMASSHMILKPEFFRSGEKRYTCRLCRYTVELRLDIETHIRETHKSNRQKKEKEKKDDEQNFFCCEDECGRYFKTLNLLRRHIRNFHNIRYPLFYQAAPRTKNNCKPAQDNVTCFSCGKITKNERAVMTLHAKVHFSQAQRRALYLYKCPLQLTSGPCTFSSKRKTETIEHYRAVHSAEENFCKQSENKYFCFSCSRVMSTLAGMESHCRYRCRAR